MESGFDMLVLIVAVSVIIICCLCCSWMKICECSRCILKKITRCHRSKRDTQTHPVEMTSISGQSGLRESRMRQNTDAQNPNTGLVVQLPLNPEQQFTYLPRRLASDLDLPPSYEQLFGK